MADVHQIRNTRLHLEGHFVLTNPCLNFRVTVSLRFNPIEGRNGIDQISLLRCRNPIWPIHIKNGTTRASEFDTLISARQETGVPLPGCNGLALPEFPCRHHNHKTR